MSGQISQGVTFTAFMAALPLMARDLGSHGPFVAQMTMALASMGLMCGAIVSGWILERLGTRGMFLATTLVFAVVGGAGLILRDPWPLLVSRFVTGFASVCMTTACMWGIAAEYDGDRRARVLGISAAVSNVASLTSTVLGGYIAEHGSWRLTFLQYPAVGLIACALAFVSVRQVKPEREDAGEARQGFLLRLLPFYLLVTVLFAVLFMGSTQFAFMLEEDGIRNPATRALFMGINTVVGAVTSFCYGALQQRLGVRGIFTFGLLCMTAAAASLGRGVGPAYAILGATLMGLYTGVVGPYIYHVVSERTDAFSRGRAIGLLSAFAYLGGFLNPVVFAPLSDAIGLRNVFMVVACLMAVLAIFTAIRLIRPRPVSGGVSPH
jgi:MFS family permease